MASRSELKNVTTARLKTVRTLIKAKDWDMAGYLMGYVMECAFKAVICRNLKQKDYPDNIKHDKMRSFFSTHDFETLLMISGTFDIFKLKRGPKKVLDNWSKFTINYPSNWTEIRYKTGFWNESIVKEIYNCLTDDTHGLLAQFKKNKRW